MNNDGYVVDDCKKDLDLQCETQNSDTLPSKLDAEALSTTSVEISVCTKGLEPRLYRRRWVMVLLFASYSLTNSYQWIHLSIIGDKILFFYNESLPDSQYQQEVALDWLSMVYMLAYVPLIFPVTWLLDKKGLRIVAIIGSLLNAVGAWVKCASIRPDLFAVLMFAQTICSIAQVFILGIPARVAAVWFGPNEVSTATSIGVFGNQLGTAFGFLIPPEVVPNSNNTEFLQDRMSYLMYGGAAVTTAQFILVVIFFQDSPPIPPSIAQVTAVDSTAANKMNYLASLRRLILNRGFALLLVTYGLNTGSYYEICTLLNPIVLYYFPGQTENAGRIGLTIVLSGLGGSILAGIFLDRTKFYKSTTVFIYAMSCAAMLAFTFTLDVDLIWVVFLCGGLLGFFMTGYLPVGFEFAAELTFPESEGTSSGLLNASAQIFGIALIMGIRAMIANVPNGMLAGNITISAILFVGALLTIVIPSDLRRQKAQHKMDRDSKESTPDISSSQMSDRTSVTSF
jgi:FLVCR family feline leukemia virus subgroup C receptor-related protein